MLHRLFSVSQYHKTPNLQLGNKMKTLYLIKHAELNQNKIKWDTALAKWTRDVTKSYWERGLPDKNKDNTREGC